VRHFTPNSGIALKRRTALRKAIPTQASSTAPPSCADPAGDVDLGDLRAALLAEPALLRW
jgi:hypothetical protein